MLNLIASAIFDLRNNLEITSISLMYYLNCYGCSIKYSVDDLNNILVKNCSTIQYHLNNKTNVCYNNNNLI